MGGCVLPWRGVFPAEYEKRAKSGATGPIVGGTCWKKIGRKSRQKLCKKGTIGISSKVSIHTLIVQRSIPEIVRRWLDGAKWLGKISAKKWDKI